jgi:prolyl oligopeptidase
MPPAPQDGTTDIFHGITVPDPFRPLEDGTRADVRAWVEAQDQQGRAYLESLPSRRTIRKFFDSLLDYPRVGIPQQHGTRTSPISTTASPTSRAMACRSRWPLRAAR